MKNTFLILIVIVVAAAAVFLTVNKKSSVVENRSGNTGGPEISSAPAVNQAPQNNPAATGFQPPLDRAAERITKKPFGIHIAPRTSPVQPERFQGYHTGADFEIFPEETDADITVRAVCSGQLLSKRSASGYGGVAVQACQLGDQPITVVYGHLNLASISAKTGDKLDAGSALGNLGAGYSSQTDGERKHLHLGFHKGDSINILGYVSSQGQLSGWLDPCAYVCGR